MRIGMLLPSNAALHEPGDGRYVQAKRQAEALESLGHQVIHMESWNSIPRDAMDVLHVFEGGFGNYVLIPERPRAFPRIVLAPFIDSNVPFWRYRLAAAVHLGRRLYSPQYVLRQQGLNADLVIARSTHEHERITRGLGIPKSRVVIVHNGASPPAVIDSEEARRRLNLPVKFILHVGMYTEPRKNTLRLAHAARALGYPMFVAGTAREGPVLQALKAMAGDGLRLLGFLDRKTLESLYTACEVFALPSIHEGTGLVALEAASCGAKVVITKNGGPPDYFENLAEYVDPYNDADIIRGLRTAWEKPKTDDLRKHVLETLTWRQSAEQLVAAYTRPL